MGVTKSQPIQLSLLIIEMLILEEIFNQSQPFVGLRFVGYINFIEEWDRKLFVLSD